jgi:hypothetical protein
MAIEVSRTRLRLLSWQSRQRFGRNHELTAACERAEISMAPDEVDLVLELLAALPGVGGKHLRCIFFGR